MCVLNKELLYWLPAALEGTQAEAVATMSDTVPYSASFAAVVNQKNFFRVGRVGLSVTP